MKRFLALVLAVLMVLSLAACGGKDDNVEKRGVVGADSTTRFSSSEHNEHKEKEKESLNRETIYYSNLSAALMDLENGKIDGFLLKSFLLHISLPAMRI
ncbi:MAG: hypothetical protein J6J43_01600 [Oscillospiraceae bacterium]|nr:hypothetical protein [Oscillospiraceae bacterium]